MNSILILTRRNSVVKQLINNLVSQQKKNLSTLNIRDQSLLKRNELIKSVCLTQVRETSSFFTRLPAQAIWKGVTSVSNAGRKRGRGKGAGKRTAKDLNKGQVIGIGKQNMIWPGLNAPIIKGSEKVEIKKLPEDSSYLEKIITYRNEMDVFKKRYLHPMERGWSGNKILGRWYGSPETPNGEIMADFDSKILQVTSRLRMTANLGKVKQIKTLAITGNKNGCAGFAFARSKDSRASLKNAVNKAGQRLRYIELEDNRTVTHDFYCRFGFNEIVVHKKPPGFGIVAHRVLKAACDVLGIKDIYIQTFGPSKNYLNILRAFFIGLNCQKSYQELADEKGLHLVEFREEFDYLPKVLASPSNGKVRTRDDIKPDEVMDFHMHLFDGHIRKYEEKEMPFYTRSDGYFKFLKDYHYQKSRQDVRVYLKSKFGGLESFLTMREKEEKMKKKTLLADQLTKETDENEEITKTA